MIILITFLPFLTKPRKQVILLTRKPISINELTHEINKQKQEIQDLKAAQLIMQKDILEIKTKNSKGKQKEEDLEENDDTSQLPSPSDTNFLLILSEITTRKWIINISIRCCMKIILILSRTGFLLPELVLDQKPVW